MRYICQNWKGPRPGALHARQEVIAALRQRLPVASDPGVDVHGPRSYPERETTLCFTGHRRLTDEPSLRAMLTALLEKLYTQGYRTFLSGAALGFDTLAAHAVVALRALHPDARLVLCIPCPDQCSKWTDAQCAAYERLLYLADEIRVLSSHYYDGCMQSRNRYMVDRSQLCVAYMTTVGHSGTVATVRYAVSQDVPVVNIAVPGALEEYISQP